MLASLISVLVAACPTDPIDLLFSSYAGDRPGASVMVIKDGAVVFERTYGLANLDTREVVRSDTNFRLASITKQFTATAILLLADRKRLTLDDPIGRHLPELAHAAPKVTLRHLLSHRTDLPEYETLLPVGSVDQVVDRDVLRLVIDKAASGSEFAPTAAFHYSNTNYALLALVVERITKLSYGEFLRRNVFVPLGMTDTVVYKADAKIARRALGYRGDQDHFALADQDRTTAVVGDGGIYSSARDLARWVAALDHGTVLTAKRFAEATTPVVATDVVGVSYGLGWRLSDHRNEPLVFHSGTTSGFKNALLYVPGRHLAAIVLTNRRGNDAVLLASCLIERFWDRAR